MGLLLLDQVKRGLISFATTPADAETAMEVARTLMASPKLRLKRIGAQLVSAFRAQDVRLSVAADASARRDQELQRVDEGKPNAITAARVTVQADVRHSIAHADGAIAALEAAGVPQELWPPVLLEYRRNVAKGVEVRVLESPQATEAAGLPGGEAGKATDPCQNPPESESGL